MFCVIGGVVKGLLKSCYRVVVELLLSSSNLSPVVSYSLCYISPDIFVSQISYSRRTSHCLSFHAYTSSFHYTLLYLTLFLYGIRCLGLPCQLHCCLYLRVNVYRKLYHSFLNIFYNSLATCVSYALRCI